MFFYSSVYLTTDNIHACSNILTCYSVFITVTSLHMNRLLHDISMSVVCIISSMILFLEATTSHKLCWHKMMMWRWKLVSKKFPVVSTHVWFNLQPPKFSLHSLLPTFLTDSTHFIGRNLKSINHLLIYINWKIVGDPCYPVFRCGTKCSVYVYV